MLAFMTDRQMHLHRLRSAGELPDAGTYDPDAGPQDEIEIEQVAPEPFKVERFRATVVAIDDHGHYRLLRYRKADGAEGTAKVNVDGEPPEWGVVTLRIVRQVYVRLAPDTNRL